ncbi:MAG: MarR family transcriptional regulator [Myxococcales bacterium]|nr:MAG: MarR family transcriptional regulator [Myxococcales bacterium]
MVKSKLRLDRFLPFRLSVASNAVSRAIARAYEARFGLKVTEWRLIAVLAEGGLTQQAIVERTVLDKVSVSRAAQALVDRRLARREPVEGDARSHLLTLTPEGQRLHDEVAPLALSMEATMLGGLSRDEVADLHRLLSRLQRAAEQLDAEQLA